MFSDPVVGRNFFGRQDIIDLLVKRADALKSGYRQNVAIIGHQQLGKSSILRHFLHIYQNPDVISVYVEIKFQALDYFVDQFVRSLLYQYLLGCGDAEQNDSLARLIDKCSTRIPETVRRIHEITHLLKHRHAEEAYRRLFELTSAVRAESGKNCIVVLDEFHRLGEFGIRNAFSDFGKRIMVQKDTMYILSSSSFSASRKILAEKLALLFGNFERVYLEPLQFETSFSFLENKLAPVQVPDNLKFFLVAFTDGHPFFLDTLCKRLKETAAGGGENTLSSESVADTFLKLMFESQGIWNQYFMKLLSPWVRPDCRGSQILILTKLAAGLNKLKDIAGAINRGQKETSKQIQELMGHELIVKTGVFYRFHNKIFKFWLKEVYEKKELSVFGSGREEDFLNVIRALIAEYGELLKLDVEKRVLSLFSAFNNELVEFGEKGRQLPKFTEFITAQPGQAAPDTPTRRLIARGHGRCWICQITEQRATEKEVLELMQCEPGAKSPAATKVLIALRGLDDNARLLAKDKKIFTLGLSRLNTLMDIYGKSPIIPS